MGYHRGQGPDSSNQIVIGILYGRIFTRFETTLILAGLHGNHWQRPNSSSTVNPMEAAER